MGLVINLCLIAPHIVPRTTFSKRIRAISYVRIQLIGYSDDGSSYV